MTQTIDFYPGSNTWMEDLGPIQVGDLVVVHRAEYGPTGAVLREWEDTGTILRDGYTVANEVDRLATPPNGAPAWLILMTDGSHMALGSQWMHQRRSDADGGDFVEVNLYVERDTAILNRP